MTSIPKTMKAGQWDPKAKAVVINDVAVPEPGPNQFLVKIRSASLCHSDLMNMQYPAADRPVTIGHEGVGHIVKMHPSAERKGFKVGDGIGFGYFVDCCFECEGCMVHNMHCELGTSKVQGFAADGYFAEYAVVDYHNGIVLDESQWDLRTASAMFCAGVTAFNSVDSCNATPGQWFAVVGCGGLGQLATQYATAMGLRVIGIDVADANLEETRKQGAEHVFNSRTSAGSYIDEIKKITGGGVHHVAVYTNAQPAFVNAPKVLRIGGTLMIIGIAPQPLEFTAMDVVLGRYKIKADSTGIPQRIPKAIAFSAKHNIRPVVDVRGGLDQLAGMVQEMREGRLTKRTAVAFD
ncbi:alcohol dehydrogenase [Ophiostoma piceae UAMH 11346]|uniref:Alcohol dehydrogenase n=1 Tax=Ophiostoma piceae (strain UAMH 11346) TaxID=1262450 RepID=S3BYD8_OPHP1|nr:alcohol dehydrogenase [Ophiostoma piceae UAMH 11346]